MRKSARNIVEVFRQASVSEVSAGLSWYETANAHCRNLHQNIEIAAGIVAALSPGLKWVLNIEAAQRVINHEALDGLGVRWYANVVKAQRILAGEHPSKVLGGNKVRAFYNCMVNPESRLHVCVDGHAYSIWIGERVSTQETPKLTTKRYNAIAVDYMHAAAEVGIRPLQMQAITWTAWRRIVGVNYEDRVAPAEEEVPF